MLFLAPQLATIFAKAMEHVQLAYTSSAQVHIYGFVFLVLVETGCVLFIASQLARIFCEIRKKKRTRSSSIARLQRRSKCMDQ